MSATSQDITTKLTRKLFFLQQGFTFFGSPPLLYLLSLITGLTSEQSSYITTRINIYCTIIAGWVIPYFMMRWAVRRLWSGTLRAIKGNRPAGQS